MFFVLYSIYMDTYIDQLTPLTLAVRGNNGLKYMTAIPTWWTSLYSQSLFTAH